MSGAARPEVLVLGAGVIGASCAFHLARRGCAVTVVDRGPAPGAGSTSRATGGFRATYGTAINVQLSLLAARRLRTFEAETGVDPELRAVGYLWLGTPASLPGLEAAVALQRAAGLTTSRVVGPAELGRLAPGISLQGLAGGVHGASDGVFRPMRLLTGYLEAAARLGAEVRFGEAVEAIERDGAGRLTGVRTSAREYRPGQVVNAAGAWAREVAALAGLELPVVPLKRQVAVTVPTAALPPSTPLTIWADDGFHLRERDGRVLLLWPAAPASADPWDTTVEPAWLDEVERRTRERVPALEGVALDRPAAWAGLYEMSPDHHALLGRPPGFPNLVLVNGSSGHGVMHSPALGLLAAELLLDGATRSLDASALRPGRFAEGQPVAGSAWL